MNHVLSHVLRTGVLISIALVVFGSVLTFIHHEPDYFTHARPITQVTLVAEPFPHTIGAMLEHIAHFRGQGFVILGLLVLLMTPIISIATVTIAFALQKNHIFAVISALVLAILILALILGKSD